MALIKQVGHQGRIPIQAQGELGEVVGTDRKAIEALGKGRRSDHIAGQFAHHQHLQTVFASHQALAGHLGQHAIALFWGAAEGHHRLGVGEPHGVAHPLEGLAFQAEGLPKPWGGVAGGAAPAEHRVLLLGFKVAAAQQPGVFIALEIGEAQHHRPGKEGRRDPAHALGQPIDVVVGWPEIGGGELGDRLAIRRIPELIGLQQGHRMDLDLVGDDEFEPGQADAIAGDRRQVEGLIRIAHVDQDPGAGGRQIAELLLLKPKGQLTPVNQPLIALAAAGRDRFTIGNHGRAITRTDDGGDAHFAGNDRRMAGAPALVGDHAAGQLEDRLPIGIGAIGHQQIPLLEAGDGRGILDDPGPAGADRGPYRPAPGDHGRLVGFQMPAAQHLGGTPRFHRFRSRLQDEELAGEAIFGPFDVHGRGLAAAGAVVGLDAAGPTGQLQGLVVRDGKAGPIGRIDSQGAGVAQSQLLVRGRLGMEGLAGNGFAWKDFAGNGLAGNGFAGNGLAWSWLGWAGLASCVLARHGGPCGIPGLERCRQGVGR